jgi:hypothetical protein
LICDNPPYFPLSGCGFFQFEGFYGAALALILLTVCGMVLPADSNMIRAYTSIRRHIIAFMASPSRGGRTPPEPEEASARVTKTTLTLASYAATIAGGAVLGTFVDSIRSWWNTKASAFEIAAVCVIFILSVALLLLFRKLRQLQDLLLANAPPIEQILASAERSPMAAVDVMANVNPRPGTERRRDELDTRGIKEAFRRKRQHFEV